MEVLSSRTILRPARYERTVAFYRDRLRLGIFRDYGGGTVFFAGQGLVEVAAHGHDPDAPTAATLFLQVRDADAARAELEAAGVTIVRPPVTEPWGLIEMWIDDPDGTRIIVVEIPADHPLRRDVRGD